ncbi:hypothetical protein COOONC_08642 [Cooperia oncophora]
MNLVQQDHNLQSHLLDLILEFVKPSLMCEMLRSITIDGSNFKKRKRQGGESDDNNYSFRRSKRFHEGQHPRSRNSIWGVSFQRLSPEETEKRLDALSSSASSSTMGTGPVCSGKS